MRDDFSELPTNASCYTLNSATSIYVYRNNIRDTFTQIGGKWYRSATTTYSSVPTNSVCWLYSDITGLSSNAEFLPIYEAIAFILAMFVFALVWSLFRRLGKWRA